MAPTVKCCERKSAPRDSPRLRCSSRPIFGRPQLLEESPYLNDELIAGLFASESSRLNSTKLIAVCMLQFSKRQGMKEMLAPRAVKVKQGVQKLISHRASRSHIHMWSRIQLLIVLVMV